MLHTVPQRSRMKKVDYFGLWQHRESHPKFSFHKKQKIKHEHEIDIQRENRQKAAYYDHGHNEFILQRRAEITIQKNELKRLTTTNLIHKSAMSERDTIIRRDELIHAKKVLSELL